MPGPLDFPSGPTPSVPVPFASVAPGVPMASPMRHMLIIDSQRSAGLSPQGSREAASGRPLTGLGDQTRVLHLKPGSPLQTQFPPMQLGDQGGIAGGVANGNPGGIPPTGIAPSQFKLMIPQ